MSAERINEVPDEDDIDFDPDLDEEVFQPVLPEFEPEQGSYIGEYRAWLYGGY